MDMRKLMTFSLILALCFFGTAGAEPGKSKSGKGKKHPHAVEYHRKPDPDSYFHRHGYTQLKIPPGHYPQPGQCRIWYPGRPPGHQPPPGACHRLRGQILPGAWLIRHPVDRPGHVHVLVSDDRRPGSILVTGELETATGALIRVLLNP